MLVHLRSLILLALLATIASTLSVYPHQLAYFNEAAGGPENGYKHLLGSNLDWGQNWLYLKRWMDAHEKAKPLRIHGFRKYDPGSIGIACASDSQSKIGPGWYAVSVNDLQKRGVLAPVMGKSLPNSSDLALALQGKAPVNRLATSIFIFYVE